MEPKEYKRPSALHISSPSLFGLPALLDDAYSPTDEGHPSSDEASASASSSPAATFTAASPSTPTTAPLPTPSSSETTKPTPPPTTGAAQKEKRKRSRVTPDQLVHLERFFALDRSPTAARRREISDLLRMNERQTQIWFQNRRAKAKLLETKKQLHHIQHHPHTSSLLATSHHHQHISSPPDTPPQLSAGFERELHDLIHEPEPITIIPCTDLSIGTWRRIASSTPHRHDLVAYFSPSRRSLTWFIHSSGFGFKMELPYSSIARMELQPLAPTGMVGVGVGGGMAIASFYLNRPPVFYLEGGGASGSTSGGQPGEWRKCQDWTEGTQASKVLKHDLIGNAALLAHIVSALNPPPSSSSTSSSTSEEPTAGVSIHTPLSSSSTMFPPQSSFPRRPDHMLHGRKRSFSGPPAPEMMYHHHYPYDTSFPPPTSYTPPATGEFSSMSSMSSMMTPTRDPEMGVVSISQLAAPRPYTAPSRLLQQQQQQQHQGYALHSAPPSLLTASFVDAQSGEAGETGGGYTTSLAGALGNPHLS